MNKYRLQYRLDGVLVEVTGINGNTLEEAVAAGRRLCLAKLTKEYRGMSLDHLSGWPRVVGVITKDAWEEA